MSYASEIEARAIYNNWNSYSRGVGRLRIQGITEQHSGSRWYGNRIGTEVCWKRSSRYSYHDNNENNGSDWILRVFADGTGYFYPDKLGEFNYPTASSIRDMVYAHFRVIKEESHESNNYRNRKFQILRRKPIGQLSRKYFVSAIAFGDYLKNKYNDLEGDNNG